jgi:hypothetical protein
MIDHTINNSNSLILNWPKVSGAVSYTIHKNGWPFAMVYSNKSKYWQRRAAFNLSQMKKKYWNTVDLIA